MNGKRPYIICHMASSIDCKIDGSALQNVMRPGEYEALHSKLGGNAWICGCTGLRDVYQSLGTPGDGGERLSLYLIHIFERAVELVSSYLPISTTDLRGQR